MRLVVALSSESELRVLGPLLRAGSEVLARPSSAAELASAISALRPAAALIQASGRVLDPTVLAAAERAGTRVVALAASADERRTADGLGLREVLAADAPWEEIEDLLTGTLRAPTAGASPVQGRGSVVTVWGPVGAPGRTTVAITVAAELAATGRRVVLVDADTHGAAVAASLGLLDEAPGIAAACRLAATGALDARELQRIAETCRTPTGVLRVLTGIGRPARWPELSAERMTAVLAACRDWADAVVVDTAFNLETDEELVSDVAGPRRNAATIAALEAADEIVAVGAGDAVSIARLLRAHADLAELAPRKRMHVVVNKVRRSAVGLQPVSQLSSALLRFGGVERATYAPWDPAACDAALLSARTLQEAAPRSPLTAVLRDFVHEELLGSDAVSLRPGRHRPAGSRRAS